VGGLPRGGWAVHLGLSRWELFGRSEPQPACILDGYLPHPGVADAIRLNHAAHLHGYREKDRPVIMQSALWFENLLTEKGIPHEWHLNPGYHEEAYWSDHVDEYLRWYTRDW
jgi:hypothetical protein